MPNTAINIAFESNDTELYITIDGDALYRLSPNAYRERYIYAGHKASIDELYCIVLRNWDEAPTCLKKLNTDMVYHDNYTHSKEVVNQFKICARYLKNSTIFARQRIDVQVGGEPHVLLRANGFITHLNAFDPILTTYCPSGVPTKRYYYPCYNSVPLAIRELLSIPHRDTNDLMTAFHKFFYVWDLIPENGKEIPMNDTPKNTPYKAIMLFDTIDQTNGYNGSVFLYSSGGIRRMDFAAYLHRVEEAHNAPYQLVKVWRSDLSDIDKAHFDAMMKSTYPEKNGNKLGTIYMCFRALWYAATKELMSTTAWEEK